MREITEWRWLGTVTVAVGAVAATYPAGAQAADNVVVVVSPTQTLPSVGLGDKAIGTFGYRPALPDPDGLGPLLAEPESIWVTGYGSGALNTQNPTVLKFTGVSLGQTVLGTTMVSEAQSRFFYTEGNTNYTVSGNQGGSSFLFNPLQVGTGAGAIAPYSNAWTIEGVTVNNGSGQPNAATISSDRFDRYSLKQVTSNADALVQLTNLANLSDLQSAIGVTSAVIPIRQSAWSTDGQGLYQCDTTGGILRLDAVPRAAGVNVVQQIVTSARAKTISEPAVLKAGFADRILFLGKSGDANEGGINYVDYSGTVLTADSDVKTLISGAAVKDFLDGGVAGRTDSPNLWSLSAKVEYAATDPASPPVVVPGTPGHFTLYVMDNGTKTLFALDDQNRMHKVTTRDEVTAAGVGGGSSFLRLQNRQTLTPGGFQATQVLFTVNTASNVMGAFDYTVGDFDRDNDVDGVDKSAFLSALQPRKNYTTATLPAAGVANSRYDLNGNRTIDWKDVKVLQSYRNFKNGDANLDGAVDQSDLTLAAANYYTVSGTTDKTWGLGDFASLSPAATTYAPTAADANIVNFVDLQVLGANWMAPHLTIGDVDALGYTGQLRDDVIAALVPEPSSAGLLLAGATLLLRRRRKGANGAR